MTKKTKRYTAFLLSLMMVMSAVPALAQEGQAITGAIGFGGIILEEPQGTVNPAGPVLGQNVALELTIGVPKTFSVYGFDYTDVTGFFDSRPEMKISGVTKTEVPGVTVYGTQVYLYDFTLNPGALYLDYIYPSNVVSFDGTTASQMNGANWTLKVIADTAPANLVPKGQLLDETTETINAAVGSRKTVSFYGFDYTTPENFFNDPSVDVSYESFAVPGVYANGAHAVYLYNMTIKLNQPYNTGDAGRLYTNNIVFYNNNEATQTYYTDWRINVTEDAAEAEPLAEQEAAPAEKPDLSNVRLVVTSNLNSQERVKLGTEAYMNASIEGGEGMTFHIWWQSSTDGGQTWTDIPGAVGNQYRTVITRENAGMEWRACADLIDWEKSE